MYSYEFRKNTHKMDNEQNKGIQEYLKLFNNRKTRNNIKSYSLLRSGGENYAKPNILNSSDKNDILKIRSNGESDVTEIQDGLSLAGYTNLDGTPIKTDGIFGAKTQDAYNRFWKDAFPTEPNYLKNSSKWYNGAQSAVNNTIYNQPN